MASKIMLVLDSADDQEFLEKVLEGLKYTVISMKKGKDLSEQLIDHFPDVVFASTLGRNQKILSALGKIKEVRGKPKLVFVKQKNESHKLTPEQKNILDGTIYTPVDPFKLIDILANTTELDKKTLRKRYNEMLASDRGKGRSENIEFEGESIDEKGLETQKKSQNLSKVDGFGETKVFGNKEPTADRKIEFEKDSNLGKVESSDKVRPETSGSITRTGDERETRQGAETDNLVSGPQENVLINDPERQKKYREITDRFKATGEKPQPIDVQKLREAQAKQSEQVQEDPSVKVKRSHFLKTLFSMSAKDVEKKD